MSLRASHLRASACAPLHRAPSRLAAALLVASLSMSAPARANGRFPTANQLVADPGDPTFLAVRATYGILLSKDRGATWDWICEQGVGYGVPQEDPAIALSASSVVVATSHGLAQSIDKGCGWSFGIADAVVDVVVSPNNPHTVLALASSGSAARDGGTTPFTAKVFRTVDDGAHWTGIDAVIDPAIRGETIELAASDPHRVYITGIRIDGGDPAGVLLVSTNDGASYTELPIALAEGETAPFLAAVDPTDADRLYVRLPAGNGGRLVVSENGGATFKTILSTVGAMRGFALSADGAKIYAGGPVDGLQMAPRATFAFQTKSSVEVQCLAMVDGALYACGDEINGFVLARSLDDGTTFAPLLHQGCMRGPLACAGDASTAQCVEAFPYMLQQLGGCHGGDEEEPPRDAGGPSPGADAGDAAADATLPAPGAGADAAAIDAQGDVAPSSCACREAPAAGASGFAAIGALVSAAFVGRRRRRAL